MEPSALERVEVHRDVELVGREAAAGRAAGLHGLELPCRPGMPPPMSKTISRSVMPIGTSTRPVLLTLPTSEKILVPVEPSVPMDAEPVGALAA